MSSSSSMQSPCLASWNSIEARADSPQRSRPRKTGIGVTDIKDLLSDQSGTEQGHAQGQTHGHPKERNRHEQRQKIANVRKSFRQATDISQTDPPGRPQGVEPLLLRPRPVPGT